MLRSGEHQIGDDQARSWIEAGTIPNGSMPFALASGGWVIAAQAFQAAPLMDLTDDGGMWGKQARHFTLTREV
jgi:hypothetical protein